VFSGAFDAGAHADESCKSGSSKESSKSGRSNGPHPLEPATSHSVARAPPPPHAHELVERAANWLRDEGVAEWPHARASAVRMLASLLLARMAEEKEASGAYAAGGTDAWVARAVAVMQERLHGAPPRAAATRKEHDEQHREQAGGGQLPLVFQLLAPPLPLPGIYIYIYIYIYI
jgi:hypothetical protein